MKEGVIMTTTTLNSKTGLLSAEKPTKVRWWVFISLLILTSVNYVDRAVISVLMPYIQADLGFSPQMVGVILSAFFWGLCAHADSLRLAL